MPLRYFFDRLRYSLLVLWGVVTLVFFLFNVLPTDPARLAARQRDEPCDGGKRAAAALSPANFPALTD